MVPRSGVSWSCFRTVLRAAAGPVVGAVVALLGLVPSLPVSARLEPAVAVIALCTGLGIAVSMPRFPRGTVAALAAAGALTAALMVITGPPGVHDAMRPLATSRFSLASPARSGEAAPLSG